MNAGLGWEGGEAVQTYSCFYNFSVLKGRLERKGSGHIFQDCCVLPARCFSHMLSIFAVMV